MPQGRSLGQGYPLAAGEVPGGAAVLAGAVLPIVASFQGEGMRGAAVAVFGLGWGALIGRRVGEAFLKDGIAIGWLWFSSPRGGGHPGMLSRCC